MNSAAISRSATEFNPIDSERIELNEDWEMMYWTRRFGCDIDQLLQALVTVGVSAAAVEEYLRTAG
jgi:hypothetical protein